jgi:hypothetical protein
MTEWLKLMLEEIARKQAERDAGLAESERRAGERASGAQRPAAQPAKPAKTGDR